MKLLQVERSITERTSLWLLNIANDSGVGSVSETAHKTRIELVCGVKRILHVPEEDHRVTARHASIRLSGRASPIMVRGGLGLWWNHDTPLSSAPFFLVPRRQGAHYELCFILPHLAQVHHSLSMKFPQL